MHILYREARLEYAEPRLTRKTGLSLAAATANASTMYVSYLSNRLNNLQHPAITTGLYNPPYNIIRGKHQCLCFNDLQELEVVGRVTLLPKVDRKSKLVKCEEFEGEFTEENDDEQCHGFFWDGWMCIAKNDAIIKSTVMLRTKITETGMWAVKEVSQKRTSKL